MSEKASPEESLLCKDDLESPSFALFSSSSPVMALTSTVAVPNCCGLAAQGLVARTLSNVSLFCSTQLLDSENYFFPQTLNALIHEVWKSSSISWNPHLTHRLS